MARNGKIARLPRKIRDELNRRLENGEQGSLLLRWLNQLPAVKKLLARVFDHVEISRQNVCEWRAGGFLEWQAQQDLLAQTRTFVADAGELADTEGQLRTPNPPHRFGARGRFRTPSKEISCSTSIGCEIMRLSPTGHKVAGCCHSVAILLPVLLPLKRLADNDVTDVATLRSAIIIIYLL